MLKIRFSQEMNRKKLHEAEIRLADGASIGDVVRKTGVSKSAYYAYLQSLGEAANEHARRIDRIRRANSRRKEVKPEAPLEKRFAHKRAMKRRPA